MLESVHCPTCSTHYGLRPQRVRPGLRRARCFRCSALFSIEQEVLKLTSPVSEAPATAAGADMGISPDDLLDLQPIHEELPTFDFPEAAPVAADGMPSLTLGDLEGADEEILEKTLVTDSGVAHPETQVPAQTAPAEPEAEDGGDGSGSYSSAKDAIAKLLGHVPAPEPQHERRAFGRSARQMDVEATLDALESTLGGVPAKDLESKPTAPPPELTQSELEPARPMASTMKLTHDEIMSAMKAASIPLPSSAPRPTMTTPSVAPVVPAPPPARESAQPEAEANLLKVQVGQEVYSHVSLDQITTWIEQGRIQDFHMVARQFSENWIEAGKVPSLRPVFERVRRQQVPSAQQAQAVILPPPNETAPIKKSLFGGLFNRG